MLGQTVLLRGVNDDPETLTALMRAFVETRIKPYYLHHGDLAPGTGHLRTTIAEGQALMRRPARRGLRPLPADLHPRHPRRPREGPGRAGLPLGRRRRGPRRPPPRLSAEGRLMAWTRRYDEAEPQRVNKWLGQSGVCSRREAEGLIERAWSPSTARWSTTPAARSSPARPWSCRTAAGARAAQRRAAQADGHRLRPSRSTARSRPCAC